MNHQQRVPVPCQEAGENNLDKVKAMIQAAGSWTALNAERQMIAKFPSWAFGSGSSSHSYS